MSVLFDTTQEVSKAMRSFAESAERMRQEVWRIYKKAIRDALAELKELPDFDDVKRIGKNESTGRSVSRGDYDTDGMNARATDKNWVQGGSSTRTAWCPRSSCSPPCRTTDPRKVDCVQPSPTALFTGGPALRLIDIALAVQESGGELALDDEIRRYIRVVGKDWAAHWNCPPHVAAGVLEFTGDCVARAGTLDSFPPEFREKVTRAAAGMDPAEYLRMLAEMVRILDREPAPEYDELPMAGWEFLQVFPHLFGFDAVLMDEGDLPFADNVRRFVTAEHPYCTDRAIALTTEAQRALALFPGGQCLKGSLYWATRDGLRELVDTVNDHMQREHS